MTALVNGLEADGLVRRVPSPVDARHVVVRATPRGHRLLHAGRRRRVQRLDELLAATNDEDLVILDRAAFLIEQAIA